MALFKPGQRRKYIVDPSFQFKYLITWLIIFLGFIAVIVVGLMIGLKIMHASTTYGLKEIGLMLKVDAAFIILVTIVTGIYILILSHRVAGPAFRLEKSIQRMTNGDYDFTIRLREKDYLKHVADDLNNLLIALREKSGQLGEALEDFRALRARLESSSISTEIRDLFVKVEEDILKVLPKKQNQDKETAGHRP